MFLELSFSAIPLSIVERSCWTTPFCDHRMIGSNHPFAPTVERSSVTIPLHHSWTIVPNDPVIRSLTERLQRSQFRIVKRLSTMIPFKDRVKIVFNNLFLRSLNDRFQLSVSTIFERSLSTIFFYYRSTIVFNGSCLWSWNDRFYHPFLVTFERSFVMIPSHVIVLNHPI